MSDDAPETLVIIPTRHRTRDLRECLEILRREMAGLREVGALVCDDGEDPATAEMLAREFPEFSLLRGPRRGPGANRNAGVHDSSSRWLVFVDDDCLPWPGFLAAYQNAFRDDPQAEGAIFVGPTVRTGKKKDSLLWEAPRHSDGDGLPPSCNFAMSRELFLRSGGFDERYRYSFEDIEFFARLTQVGVPVRFVTGAGVDHPSRPIPSCRARALRWESRVLSSLDYGATALQTSYLLPRHILLVTLARFRGKRLEAENLLAAWLSMLEVAFAFAMLPGWLARFACSPRSAFWAEQVRLGKAPAKFGL